jgi:hypothetical protein
LLISPAVGYWVIYLLVALAAGALLFMGGAHLAQRRIGVEQLPEELSRVSDESRASSRLELPPGSDQPRLPVWKSFLGLFIEQLEVTSLVLV